MSDTLPVVDFRELAAGENGFRSFAQSFGDSLFHYGFGVVAEHPLSAARIESAFERCRELFALPEEAKLGYVVPESHGNRGYVPFGGERALGAQAADLKEFFHVGQEKRPEGSPLLPNVWPGQVPGFREELLSLYRSFEQIAQELLRAIALYLDVAEDTFASMIVGGDSILRLIHYPPVPADAAPGAVRAGAHEDINLITLLAEGTTGGLELQRKDGSWMPVRSLRGQLVINAGDMLQRATHGRIRSTTHRVTNPSGPNQSRYSLPFFTHPRPEVMLVPMQRPPTWEGPELASVSAGEFLKERLASIKAG